MMVDTETLDRLEREAAEAILSWAGEHKLLTDDGHAFLHTDGKPIALDVLDAIAVLRRTVPKGQAMNADSLDADRRLTEALLIIERMATVDIPAIERRAELGLAWSEVEAALPEGWLLTIKDWSRTGDPEMAGPDGWADDEIEAWAAHWADPERSIQGQGPTPAAALRALALKLRGPVV